MGIRLWWLIHRETRRNSYYLSPIQHSYGWIYLAVKNVRVWYSAFKMPWDKRYNIQQYDGERKNKLRMLRENLVWAFKYKEPCVYYFAYGLDLKKRNPNDYVGYSEFRMMRNILNIRQRENLNTLYTFNYLALTRDKFVFYKYCESLGMPCPKTIALIKNKEITFFDGGKVNMQPIEIVADHEMDAFCKEIAGESGKGAFSLEIKSRSIKINKKPSDINGLREMMGEGAFIVQERLENHGDIDAVYPNSLNTIKLITFLNDDGTVDFFDSVMRFGAGGNNIDNASQGGVFVGIEEDGTLQEVGFHEPGIRKQLVVNGVHPDTGVRFAGMKIPYWNEILQTSKEFHKFFYGIPSIGWDIAVTPNGFVFTETGEDWEIPVYQVTHGGLREKFYSTHGKSLNIRLRRY